MARMSMKSRQKLLMYWRITVILTIIVLFITPMRNIVLSPVLPGTWLPYNTFRVVQMLMDTQHFPITSPFHHPPHGSVSPVHVNLSDVTKFMYAEDPYHQFFVQKELLEASAQVDPKAAEELNTIKLFEPVMSMKERAQLMLTMHVLQKACEQNDIPFFIYEGTLLGSYRHHGLIPWDDDMDIALNASDWNKVRRVLGNIPGFTLFAPADVQWKFYLSDLPKFGDKPFKFPYIDLFFFQQHGPFVWTITWGMKNHMMVKAKHLFPLTTMKWEMLTLPAPACVRRIVEESYGVQCMTPQYVHKTNQRRSFFLQDQTDCQRLHRYLPFVFREKRNDGVVVESRRVGAKVLQEVIVPPPPNVCFED